MKHLPLHSLIILICNSEFQNSDEFHSHEIITLDSVSHQLLGEPFRHNLYNEILKEIFHTIKVKLSFGERVIINIPNLKKKDRITIVNIGSNYGSPVFYLIAKNYQPIHEHEKSIYLGDHIAEVVDSNKEPFNLVHKLPPGNLYHKIKSRGFKGITVVADVHGMREALKSAINWGSSRNHFLIFLGDVIDYGPKPIECINDVYDVVMAGRGCLVYGNHERKIERWIEQNKKNNIKVRLSEGNQVTVDLIKKLNSWQRDTFENKYCALMHTARNAYRVQNILFTHGAADPKMFKIDEHRFSDKTLSSLSLFGEIDQQEPLCDTYPNRIYNWVDHIPENHVVIVGHDIRSTDKPFCQKIS
ncbi:MAG: hypothetical protein HC836_33105 [Richelia sp. RM2_1_2]|nr:hypothetical protein [Richelia sp. RM2_1_2]